ncbi:hypothetical protein Gpo141_00009372 [Globisporangium polare]
MQSISAARCLLQALALLLALGAITSQSWAVIDLHGPSAATTTAHISPNASTSNTDAKNNSEPVGTAPHYPIEKVAFAPSRYCFQRGDHSKRECHEYAFLLNHLGDTRQHNSDGDQVAIHAATLDQAPKQRDEDQQESARVDRVLASWCVVHQSGSWFVQGAESMVCLVVLDTCLYTMAFWLLFGILTASLSLASHLWPVLFAQLESGNAFCSYTSATLGFFLVLEWWGYGAYFVDRAYLQSLSLAWRYGCAFRLLCGSVLLSLVAARITLHMSIRSRTNYAQLHAAPPEAPSPTGESPTAARNLECQNENLDPLQCPANYHV